MPIFHHLLRALKAIGPDWRWGSAFLVDQTVVQAATAIAARADVDAVFLDVPLGSVLNHSVQMDLHNIAASGFVGLDTPLDAGVIAQGVTMDLHSVATTASVALV